MKQCKINFIDYGRYFDKTEEVIIELLRRKYEVVISPEPDYLFYGAFGYDHLHPKYSRCVKIFYSCENRFPDFNICDYALAHSHLQFDDRHFRMPYYMLDRAFGDTVEAPDAPCREFEQMSNVCTLEKGAALNRKFCCFLSSSGWADPVRDSFFEDLSAYKRIDSGGRCLNNMNNALVPNKMNFLKDYKFSMAFENSALSGYTTEKIMNALAADTVPIYWGDPDVGFDFNKEAFVCINDFDTVAEAVAEVIRLDNDNEAYLQKLYAPRCTGANYAEWQEGLFRFLENVVDQPLEGAKRTSNYGHVYSYKRDLTAMRFLFSKNRFVAKFFRKALRFLERVVLKRQKKQ